MRDWWTAVDSAEYERRADVMVKQAESFSVHGVNLKGKLTCGENIADLGGLRLAYSALKKHTDAYRKENGEDPPLINGFTVDQRFFLAWSQCWRENARKERALQLITIDPHGPKYDGISNLFFFLICTFSEWRCNGPLSNMPEFYSAFGIAEGSAMYRSPDSRVDIW